MTLAHIDGPVHGNIVDNTPLPRNVRVDEVGIISGEANESVLCFIRRIGVAFSTVDSVL